MIVLSEFFSIALQFLYIFSQFFFNKLILRSIFILSDKNQYCTFMSSRKKSSSFSSKFGNPIAKENYFMIQEEEVQKTNIDSLEYYLNEIIKSSNNINSPDFRVAVSSFQKFIFNKYEAERLSHNERNFLNELFKSISINREKRTTFEYTIYTRAIVSVEFGDKMIIANYLSNTINFIKPDNNKLTWENLGVVLEFLKKTLKNGVYLIISNLKSISYDWIQDQNKMISGFYLLCLLLKQFHDFLEPYFSQIQAMIISGLTEGGGPDVVLEAIDIAIDLQKNKNVNFKLHHFCNSLVMFLKISEKKWSIKNILFAIEKILDNFPEYAKDLSFSVNPADLLKDIKNSENVLNGLQIAPFYVRTLKVNTDSNDMINKLIEMYYNLLSHRSPYRIDALISLANIIFISKMNNYNINSDFQNKLYQKLTKYFDIDQVYYTYIALLTMRDASNFDNDAKMIFIITRPINQWIVDGFYNYCKILEAKNIKNAKPDLKQRIDRIFLVYFNNIILNQSSADKIIFALEGILKLNISMSLIPIPLANKYSLLMNHQDYKVRKLTSEFITKYQKEKPTLEMLCRILSIIGTEFTNLKDDLFRNLRREPEDPAIIPLLVSLLHDSSTLIQNYSLLYLIDLIHLDGVPEIITDFLRSTGEEMKLTTGILSKRSLRFFETVCIAYREKKNPIFQTILFPFADFLINHILQSEILPHIGLIILSYMIPISTKDTIKRIDLDKLVKHIEQSLVPHSSYRRLESTFDLLLVALKETDLRFTIYDKHFIILNKLHTICQLNKRSVNQKKLLDTISTVGAINPQYVKTQMNSIFDNEEESDVIVNTPMHFLSISKSDKVLEKLNFAATGIAVKTLLEIMDEQILSTLFSSAIEALEKIIKGGSVIDDSLLKEVFNHISSILENDDNPSNVPKMISALQAMVVVLRERIEPLMPSIIEYIYSNWNRFDHSLLIKIIEFIPISCGYDILKPYIFKLASLLVTDLNNCPTQMADDIYSVFESLSIYLPIIGVVIIPPLITWINNHAYNTKVCSPMIKKLCTLLSSKRGGKEYSTQIIRTMIKIVHINKELHDDSLSVIRILADLMGQRFILYLPSLQSVFFISPNDELTRIINAYKSGNICKGPDKGIKVKKEVIQPKKDLNAELYQEMDSTTNFDSFKPPNEASDGTQWQLWWDRFSSFFFDNIPCRAIKTCKEIAKKYSLMKDKLFPLAYCICRTINLQKYQCLDEWLVKTIKSAPSSILRTFLYIYEIYEILDLKILNFNPRVVARKAMEIDSYALAIHIYENIFQSERRVSEDTANSLITLNQHLGFTDAANGILKVTNTQGQSELSEKLGLWEDALKQYVNDPNGVHALGPNYNFVSVCSNMEPKSTLSIMNCLNHLSRFSELNELANSVLNNPNYPNSSDMRLRSLRFAATASWHLFNYSDFEKFAEQFINESKGRKKPSEDSENPDEINENYYIVVMYNILKKNFQAARRIISKIHASSCKKLFPMLGENYELVYEDMSIISSLVEAKEVIQYIELDELAKNPEKTIREDSCNSMNRIRQLWKIRFTKLKPISSVLHDHLCIRSIVLPISEQSEGFLTLIDAAIDQKRLELAESVLQYCESKDPKCEKYRSMRCKLIWARGEKEEAITSLSKLELTKETNMMLAQWIFEYGDAQKARNQLEKEISEINNLDKDSLMNYNTDLAFAELEVWANINLVLYRSNPSQIDYIVDSLEGFMNALSMAKSNSILTFTLRVLHVLFNHECEELYTKFENILKSGKISLSAWSDVVIQLMSRLASSNLGLRKTIGDLIKTIGLSHPHSVLLSLMVMTYFEGTEKQRISREIINEIRQKHPLVVSSLSRFSLELQKVALSWWEATVSKIDEVSRLYADNITHENVILHSKSGTNIKDQISPQCQMILCEICKALKNLDKMVLAAPSSFYEISYSNEFGHAMETASHWRKVYERTKDITAFQVSWNYYTTVFYAVRPLLSNLSNFTLSDASPYLANFTSEKALIPVPGTYSLTNEMKHVHIASLDQNVTIIDSKQRPRRIDLFGDDGNKYTFLLKAHEDTRLDERIMQFFSFINTCILDKRKSNKLTDNLRNRLAITTYKVSPLTPEVGMIGFVRNCVTLFDLVKNYREKKSIKLEGEYNLVIQNCEKYDELPLGTEKVKYFRYGYEACDGNDLKIILFNSSDDSMNWLQRRTTYTASLAMTSMAGYVLGLGDRHLCNIMINKSTGKLVHIDFGDSFEVAQYRSNFPEKVPFRLTRLLQNALEVSRIEGTFRKSCENSLLMMRNNSEQIIGLLSAFIYDPLRQWTKSSTQVKEEVATGKINALNDTAQINEEEKVINRISDKLGGNDFNDKMNLNVEEQVERLINDATDVKNLCMMYKGWYPWW